MIERLVARVCAAFFAFFVGVLAWSSLLIDKPASGVTVASLALFVALAVTVGVLYCVDAVAYKYSHADE